MSNTLAFAEAIKAAEAHGFTHFARALRLELSRSLVTSPACIESRVHPSPASPAQVQVGLPFTAASAA